LSQSPCHPRKAKYGNSGEFQGALACSGDHDLQRLVNFKQAHNNHGGKSAKAATTRQLPM